MVVQSRADGASSLDQWESFESPRDRFESLFVDRKESENVVVVDDSGGQMSSMLWITLRELYIQRLEAKRASSAYVANQRAILERFTRLRNLTNARVEDITQQDLQAYVSSRSLSAWTPPRTNGDAKPIANRTINNEIATLNAVFRYSGPRMPMNGFRENLGVIEWPPYFNYLDEPEPAPVHVSEDQLSAFIEATKHATAPNVSVCPPQLFWLAVLVVDSITALRRSALLSVKRPADEILIKRRELRITAEESKNKRAQTIPLGDRSDVLSLLMQLPSKPGEPLLPWKRRDGRPLSVNYFNREMKRFQRAAGIPEGDALRTKHFRSTAASEILEQEFSEDTARKRLNHKSANVIQRHYNAHRVTKADASVSDFLAKRVMSLIDDRTVNTLRFRESG